MTEFTSALLVALVPGSVLVIVLGIVTGVLIVKGRSRERELEDAVLNWSMRALNAERILDGELDGDEDDEEWRESGG